VTRSFFLKAGPPEGSPVALIPPIKQRRLIGPVGDCDPAGARIDAVNARDTAYANLSNAEILYQATVNRYQIDLDDFNRVKPNMTQQDRMQCQQALTGAYNAGVLEETYLNDAEADYNLAVQEISDGDAATTDASKCQHYNQSVADSGSCNDQTALATAKDATANTDLTAAEQIEGRYG
jgi:hypothetical protein